MEETKVEVKEEALQRNLIADLKGDIISKELLESNPIYGDGYNPYYARRRMDKRDGEDYEIVNETSVLVEAHEIGNWGARKVCSKRHFTDLVKFINEHRSDEDYDIREVANKIVRFYFINVFKYNKQTFSKRASLVGKENMETILRDIVAMPKTDDELVEGLAILVSTTFPAQYSELFGMPNEDEFIGTFGTELMDRILSYIFMNTSANIPSYVIACVYERYNEALTRILAAFGSEILPRLSAMFLTIENIEKYPGQLLAQSTDLFLHKNFTSIELVNSFITKARADKNYTIEEVQTLLERQIGFRFELPKDGIDRFGVNGPWVYFSKSMYIISNMDSWYKYKEMMIKPEQFDLLCKCVCANPVPKDIEKAELSWILAYMTTIIIDKYHRNTEETPEESKKRITMTTNLHLAAYKTALVAYQPWLNIVTNIGPVIQSTIFTNEFLEFVSQQMISSGSFEYFRFNDATLDYFLEVGDVNKVLKCARLDTNFEFIKKHFDELYVTLPYNIIPRVNTFRLPDRLDWVWKSIGRDERMSFPFPLWYMQQRKDAFTPYLSHINTDRYIAAFGINWVEEHGSICISDMVKANAITDEKVARRYLDIILLDKELRDIFLTTSGSQGIILMHSQKFLARILRCKTFDNDIKCQCIFSHLLTSIYEYTKNHDILVDYLQKFATGDTLWAYKLRLQISNFIGKVI